MTRVTLEEELFRALEYSSVDSVRKVLQSGADPNARNCNGLPALYHTAKCSTSSNCIEYVEKARLLLDAGADINAQCNAKTALSVCIDKRLPEMVAIFLEYGFDVNSVYWNPPLLKSAELKDPCIMQKLLKKGAHVNIRSKTTGWTALHVAAKNNNKECVETLLLERDIEVNAKDSNGRTPFHCAAEKGSLDALLILLKHGAISTDSILANVGHRTAAGVLAKEKGLEFSSGPWKAISIPFSNSGLDINHRDKEGRSALHFAGMSCGMKSGCGKVIEVLLSIGADINDRDARGNTPLMLSLKNSCSSSTEATLALLEHGAEVNARNVYGRSALFSLLSSTLFSPRKMSILFEYGADVNIIDDGDQTPLLYAEEVFRRNSDPSIVSPFEPEHFGGEVYCVVQLCRHITKLNTANGFSVNKTNLQSRYLLSHPSLLELQTDCENELAMLRTVRVAYGLTLYDLLTRKPEDLPLASNTKIVASFLGSGQHKSSYPVYEELLKYRFRMAVERIRLIDDAKLAGCKIFPLLPSLCIDAICDYLKDVDLKNLIEAGRP